MAGGTWMTQNKVRPGVYVRFQADAAPTGAIGERGVVALPLKLSWGPAKQVLELHAGEPVFEQLGYELTDKPALLVREAFKRAKTVLLYRLNEGAKAAAAHKELKVKARYGGARGNDIQLVVQPNVNDDTKVDVITKVGGRTVDSQTVTQAEQLTASAWVEFEGAGAIEAIAGLPLTGGDDGSVTNAEHMSFLDAIAVHDFHTVALTSSDAALCSVYAAFVKRMREDEGKKVQAVMAQYPTADNEGVISVKNGVKLADGTVLNAAQATAWVAAATAAAAMNESLTYSAYEDAVDADIRMTNSQVEDALRKGEFVFVHQRGRAVVEQDINSLTSYSPDKGQPFSKNRVIRVLDGIANDLKRIFETTYVGKTNNNEEGRQLFRAECIAYLDQLQRLNAIQPFDAQTDVLVVQGEASDSIAIQLTVQPVDAVEKIYMKVKVK
ncbi:phage tail sheath family protein [Paenibacillus profundus]|uniref:Phage tail sheath family protein n=1 Tax=Paenibacillus profundus TaxID=1173085 RepID=A0ABS8YLC5_9BACL|nr:phage tail sheath family protein [Paenibacillus profundus]MCE5171370.1 phage tail sheath family protein [Paenibacillus profundus]